MAEIVFVFNLPTLYFIFFFFCLKTTSHESERSCNIFENIRGPALTRMHGVFVH